MSYQDILRFPDSVRVETDEGLLTLEPAGEFWRATPEIEVQTYLTEGRLSVDVSSPRVGLRRIHLRWQAQMPAATRYLGDAWERGYGDLEWRGSVPERVMPWYFCVYDGAQTHGYGVGTTPAAFCFWRADPAGISLFLDVRNGGGAVFLGQRRLHVADVVTRQGVSGETPFEAAQAFCKLMCPRPRLPQHPVYGSNNWYYAYGRSSHQQILKDTELLLALAPGVPNRPYMVIDAGWQKRVIQADGSIDAPIGGPWTEGNSEFPDMPGLATQMRRMGARPGIWVRPLAAAPGLPAARLLPRERVRDASANVDVLDPSIPENLAQIESDARCVTSWGYELLKHDWSSCDLLGRWGFDMGAQLTNPGWHFADQTRTTAEIAVGLFQAIRRGAGEAVIIGCNTFSHLAAGLFELQRTGDDTSGLEWERTRKMGVNTLAFRMPQHNAFYACDADCVGLTTQVPWRLNRQWLELLSASGTPLFVSPAPEALGAEQTSALRQAFECAAQTQATGEPLDWLNLTTPREWKLMDKPVTFDWFSPAGVE